MACCAARDGGGDIDGAKADAETTRRLMRAQKLKGRKFAAIRDLYSFEAKPLGSGSFGVVKRAQDKATKMLRAVKSIRKSKLNEMPQLRREIELMDLMDHPHVVKLIDSFEDDHYVYLVMELCRGGELLEVISQQSRFSEFEAALIMEQILRAVHYLHRSLSVCHRDLKPENFLLLSKADLERNTLKLIDFGLSRQLPRGSTLRTQCGTVTYLAPEIAGKMPYNHAVDLWSCGVILYLLLCGSTPFDGKDDAETLRRIRQGSYDVSGPDWRDVSQQARDLLAGLLQRQPQQRLCSERALQDDWIRKAPSSKGVYLCNSMLRNLRAYQGRHHFMQAALRVVATQLDHGKIRELQDVFKKIDTNKDGLLSHEELEAGVMLLKDAPEDVAALLKELDMDGSGSVNYTEFIAAALDRRVYAEEEICWAAFRVFDKDGDNRISHEDLQAVLEDEGVCEALGPEVVRSLMTDVDANNDGFVDFAEFMAMMRKQHECDAARCSMHHCH